MFDFLRPIDVQLQHDKLGRLNLGELKGVKSLNINGVQYNLEEYAKYCYPERVDIIPGESFTLPLYTNNKISLKDNYFVLYQYFNRKINVGFFYTSISGNGISRFMQVTGDNFIKSGEYNVIFITKTKQKKELNINPKIKRFYCLLK